jgi:hypothetical protein
MSGGRVNAAEPLRVPRTSAGFADATQRGLDAGFGQINRLDGQLRSLKNRVQNLEYWLTNNDWRQSQIRTVNAAVATLAQYPMVDDRVWLMESVVAARRDTGADRAFYHIEGLFYREGAAAAQQGLTIASVNLESDITWNCDFDVNGIYVRVRVTGGAFNVDWHGWTRFREQVLLI